MEPWLLLLGGWPAPLYITAGILLFPGLRWAVGRAIRTDVVLGRRNRDSSRQIVL